MDKMKTAIRALGDGDASKAQSDMSDACGTLALDVDAFIMQIAAQDVRVRKVWKDICWYWVKFLAGVCERKEYGQRDEQSCHTAFLIECELSKKHIPLPDLPCDNFVSVFVGKMGGDHKTIQQTFSNLVFAWINYQATEKNDCKARCADSKIKELQGEHWYRMPLI